MSGGFNITNLVETAAIGALTGGVGAIIEQAAIQIATQVASQVIQQVGQQLGLPPAIIDAAQGAFSMAAGNPAAATQQFGQAATDAASLVDQYGQQTGASTTDVASAQSNVDDAINNLTLSGINEGNKQAGGAAGKGGWLMAMAEALGKMLNTMADKIQQDAGKLTDKTPDLTAKFGAESQQFSMLMNATNEAIKNIGEGMKTMAGRN